MLPITLLVAVCLGAPGPVGSIDPVVPDGPYRAGFKILSVSDPTRVMGGRVDVDARTPDRARSFRIHVWYPSPADAQGRTLTVGDYIAAGGAATQGHRADFPRTMGLTLTDAEWTSYTDAAMTAIRDAPPAPGRFPLIVGTLRAVSVALTAEDLASHGYVVAYAERQPRESIVADGLVREALIIEELMRDLDVTLARMRNEANVDATRLGAHGFSGDGLAPLAWAMRHPDVDAVALLETGWLSPTMTSSYQELPAFDPLALRAALFYAYSENLGRNSLEHIETLRGMRYAPRSLLYLGEPRMTHWDFATEGVMLGRMLERRAGARPGLRRAHLATYRAQLRFFDAWVKRDASAKAALAELPEATPGGAMIELTVLPATTPALSRAEFVNLLEQDVDEALRRARADLAHDPLAPVFDATWLNTTGYTYFQRGQRPQGLAALRMATEAHGSSANAFDSLSEVLEAAGQRAEALAAAEKALTLLAADRTVPADQRGPLEAGLKARIGRLR